jgi:hypothetical protein
LSGLTDEEKVRVVQHTYEEDWGKLGCDGGHYGWLESGFMEELIGGIVDDEDVGAKSAKR